MKKNERKEREEESEWKKKLKNNDCYDKREANATERKSKKRDRSKTVEWCHQEGSVRRETNRVLYYQLFGRRTGALPSVIRQRKMKIKTSESEKYEKNNQRAGHERDM